MKAVPLLQRRVVVASDAFVELAVWRLDKPLLPSTHNLKYRLAYVVAGECVVLYDNEFSSTDRLLADFNSDIARWNHENGRT